MKKCFATIILLSLLLTSCAPGSTDKDVESSVHSNYISGNTDESKTVYPSPIFLTDEENKAVKMNMQSAFYNILIEKIENTDSPITWLFVGDSITANDGNSAEEFACYPEIFQHYLINDLHRTSDCVVNTAVSGWKISDINYNNSVGRFNPDVVFVNIGTNDSFATDSDAELFSQKLTKLTADICDGGAVPIIIASGSFSDNWGDINQKSNFSARYFDSVLKAVDKTNSLFVNLYDAYEKDRAHSSGVFFCSDTVHPSRAGFLFIAQTIIRDLGIEVGNSAIMSADPDNICNYEDIAKTVNKGGVYLDYCIGDSARIKSAFKNGVTLAGGSTVAGEGKYITRRTLLQLLSNNIKNGTADFEFGSITEISDKVDKIDTSKLLILYPEKYTLNGRYISKNARSALENLISSFRGEMLIVVPPCEELDETVRAIAEEKSIPYVDLSRYLDSVKADDELLYSSLIESEGVLTSSGAVEAASLILSFLGEDFSLISSKSYTELFYPQVWGKQNTNCFSYLYHRNGSDVISELEFIPSSSSLNAKNKFSLSQKNVTLYIGQSVLSVLNNYSIIKSFNPPENGNVLITVRLKSHSSENSLKLTVRNGESIIAEEIFKTNFGAYKIIKINTTAKIDTPIHFEVSSTIGEIGYMLENITYSR